MIRMDNESIKKNIRMMTDPKNKMLVKAVKSGNLMEVQERINAGADVDAMDFDETTCLMWACINNRYDIVKFLLDAGADFNKIDDQSRSILSFACNLLSKDSKVFKAVLELDIEPDFSDPYVYTVLVNSIRDGDMKILKLLLKNETDMERITRLLYEATVYRKPGIVKFLLDKGANVHYCYRRETMLDVSIRKGFNEISKIFLDAGGKRSVR